MKEKHFIYDIAFIGNEINTDCKSIVICPEKLMEVSGQIGEFALRVKGEDRICAKTIVVNMLPEEILPIEAASKFGDDSELSGETAVFIQDYITLTSAYYNEIGLLHAIRLKEKHKKQVIYLHRSMRFQNGDSSIYRKARELGIVFEKYNPEDLKITRQDGFQIDLDNTYFNISIHIEEEALYTAPDIKPGKTYEKLAGVLRLKKNEEGFLQAGNVYLQPAGTNRRGVYVVGFAKGKSGMSSFESDVEYTFADIKKETAYVVPLVNDQREVDEKACALCYTCFRSCPHGAVERSEAGPFMKVNKNACYGCDTCVTVCPAKAVTIKNQIEKNSFSKPYKILMCENSAEIAFKELAEELDDRVEVRSIPCSNSVRKSDIYRELSDTGSKLLILGCINDACKHIDGNNKVERVVGEAKKNLSETGLDPDRIQFEKVSLRMKDRLKEIIDQFVEGQLERL